MIEGAILSLPVDAVHLPADTVALAATEAQRAALAAAYDLVAVDTLAAEATLTAGPRGSVLVEGRVVADITQTCVISLVPVIQHIDEPFSFRFVRPADAPPAPKSGSEVVIDADAPDPPEILDGPTIDVGALAEETFALAIDPYPRAPGAALPETAAGGDDLGADSPFAILAKLAKPGTGAD